MFYSRFVNTFFSINFSRLNLFKIDGLPFISVFSIYQKIFLIFNVSKRIIKKENVRIFMNTNCVINYQHQSTNDAIIKFFFTIESEFCNNSVKKLLMKRKQAVKFNVWSCKVFL